MKTILHQFFLQIEEVVHPAGGWSKDKEEQRKRKARKSVGSISPSPDSFNVRGGSSKKGIQLRRTPAP